MRGLGAFVSGFGTGYDQQLQRNRAAQQDKLNAQMAELRVNADRRDQTAADQRTAAAATAAEREARVRGAYASIANELERLSGGAVTASAGAPTGSVATEGMPASGEALADAPAVPAEDRVGRSLFRSPEALQNPEFLRFAAKQFLGAGMPEGVQWLDRLSKVQEEGGIRALQLLAGGDVRGAAEQFNRNGSKRVTGEIRPGPEGSFIVPFEGGEETITPREMLRFLRPLDAQRIAQAKYLEERLPSAERVAQVRADGARDVAQTRATAAQIIAEARRGTGSGGGGRSGGGSGGSNVQSVQNNEDGTRTIIFRDGTSRLLTGDNGQPVRGIAASQMAERILRELMKDPTNRSGTKPEDARGLADRTLGNKPAPKPLPASKSEAKVGEVYQTARGPARWNGNAFVPVQ